MKKFISIILALIMVFALCSCGKTEVAVPEPSGDGGDMIVGFIYLHNE